MFTFFGAGDSTPLPTESEASKRVASASAPSSLALPPSYEDIAQENYDAAFEAMTPHQKHTQLLFNGICSTISKLVARTSIHRDPNLHTCRLMENGIQFCTGTATCSRPGTLWGTDIFTNDSSPCTAARYMGIIDAQGGYFRTVNRPGLQNYPPSTRNGITSSAWGAWGASFVVEAAEVEIIEEETVRERDCGPLTGNLWYCAGKDCSQRNSPTPVIGTGIYAGYSNICGAAVQMGLVKPEGNGAEFSVFPFIYQQLLNHESMSSLDVHDIEEKSPASTSSTSTSPSAIKSKSKSEFHISPEEYFKLKSYDQPVYQEARLDEKEAQLAETELDYLFLHGSTKNGITSLGASFSKIPHTASSVNCPPLIVLLRKTPKCHSIPLPAIDSKHFFGVPANLHFCLGTGFGCGSVPALGEEPRSRSAQDTTSIFGVFSRRRGPPPVESVAVLPQTPAQPQQMTRNYSAFGTVIYSGNSNPCSALIHSGLGTLETGGIGISVRVCGRQRYRGSTHNGILTSNHGPNPDAFRYYTLFTRPDHIIHEPVTSTGYPPAVPYSPLRNIYLQIKQKSTNSILSRKRFTIHPYPHPIFTIEFLKRQFQVKFPNLLNDISIIDHILIEGDKALVEDSTDISLINNGDVISIFTNN